MWDLLDARGAQYPADHNVGHLYNAKPALATHYRSLDPSNTFNPGIGHTSKRANWSKWEGRPPHCHKPKFMREKPVNRISKSSSGNVQGDLAACNRYWGMLGGISQIGIESDAAYKKITLIRESILDIR